MQKVCEACGKPFDTTNSRKRFHNAACRARAHRGAVVVELPTERVPPTEAGPVAQSATATLEAVDRLDTPAGQAALVLAGRLDNGSDTGSALAAMTKELRATLAEAMAGVPAQPDRLDEIAEKRRQRLAGIGAG